MARQTRPTGDPLFDEIYGEMRKSGDNVKLALCLTIAWLLSMAISAWVPGPMNLIGTMARTIGTYFGWGAVAIGLFGAFRFAVAYTRIWGLGLPRG